MLNNTYGTIDVTLETIRTARLGQEGAIDCLVFQGLHSIALDHAGAPEDSHLLEQIEVDLWPVVATVAKRARITCIQNLVNHIS